LKGGSGEKGTIVPDHLGRRKTECSCDSDGGGAENSCEESKF